MPPALLFQLLKTLACTHVVFLAIQPVLAGQYFTGSPDALQFHGSLGEFAAWVGLAQALAALICWRFAGLGPWTTVSFLAIFALDGLQVHAGHAAMLALHIPLGTGLLAVSLALTLWLLRQRPPRGMPGLRTG